MRLQPVAARGLPGSRCSGLFMLAWPMPVIAVSCRTRPKRSPVTSSAASRKAQPAPCRAGSRRSPPRRRPVHRRRLTCPCPASRNSTSATGERQSGSPQCGPRFWAAASVVLSLCISTPRSRCAWRSSPCGVNSSSAVGAFHALRLPFPPSARRIHRHAALQVAVARLIVLVEVHCPVGAARWPPVAVVSVNPFVASSRTADPSSRNRIFASPAVASPPR
jgi:hypothetical protein